MIPIPPPEFALSTTPSGARSPAAPWSSPQGSRQCPPSNVGRSFEWFGIMKRSTRTMTLMANTTSASSRSGASDVFGKLNCMRGRQSSIIPLQSPFLLPCREVLGVDFGSFGRGHALQRIDLYPVRAQAPSSHNRYSRMPKARKRRWRTKLLLGRKRPSIFPVANRLTAGAASPLIAYQTLSVAPSGTMPSSTKRQSAIASFLASATMPTLRPRMPLSPKRSRHHSDSLLLG